MKINNSRQKVIDHNKNIKQHRKGEEMGAIYKHCVWGNVQQAKSLVCGAVQYQDTLMDPVWLAAGA